MTGNLIAFEGLDQSGKATQAGRLAERLRNAGRSVLTASFPDYGTPIGREIGLALGGGRVFTPDVMQLLYIANRYEWKPRLLEAVEAGAVVICDRYVASSVAYGEAQDLDPSWLSEIQRFLPAPDLTVLLDIDPDISARRKAVGRDRYERDRALLSRVRESYRGQAERGGWAVVDAAADVETVTRAVTRIVEARLGRP